MDLHRIRFEREGNVIAYIDQDFISVLKEDGVHITDRRTGRELFVGKVETRECA